jgi:hypothetical protein
VIVFPLLEKFQPGQAHPSFELDRPQSKLKPMSKAPYTSSEAALDIGLDGALSLL